MHVMLLPIAPAITPRLLFSYAAAMPLLLIILRLLLMRCLAPDTLCSERAAACSRHAAFLLLLFISSLSPLTILRC